MKIDQHELYKTLLSKYPWLFENSHNIDEEMYRKHFKFNDMNWYPYVFYYNLDILDELKDRLVSFSAVLAGQQGFVIRALFQMSPDTHIYCFFVKHPNDANTLVLYFDFHTRKNSDLLEFTKKHEKYEYNAAANLGFSFAKQ
jgi:hypothetical protein